MESASSQIDLPKCKWIKQTTALKILREFSALEVFKIGSHGPQVPSPLALNLKGLVAKKWAPTRLQELQLVIDMNGMEVFSARKNDQSRWVPGLIKFYEQLEQLKELRVLNLRASVDNREGRDYDEEPSQYSDWSFSGLAKDGYDLRQREAEWIVEHWPRLKNFECETTEQDHGLESDTSEAVMYMIRKLPGLRITTTEPEELADNLRF
ncbi:hypothetical protein BGW39_002311 [Mortierella sp. 14UC]|nr:hypothetical protein BGW39_002311 [Mortierella sp. 14UC]